MAIDLWSKTERIPEARWGVSDRKMFALEDGRWNDRILFGWVFSIILVGLIAWTFYAMGFEFYRSASYNILGGITPGIKLHTPGAGNESVAGAMWVYGTYSFPFVFWFAMRKLQNIRVPKIKRDRNILVTATTAMLLIPQYVFHPKFIFPNAIPVGKAKNAFGGLYLESAIGSILIVALLFSTVFISITYSALFLRALWRRQK
jgi:hypothetical protein